MRDALITMLDRGEIHQGDYCPVDVSALSQPLSSQPRIIDCAVMGSYDFRTLIEDVMKASDEDERDWASCRTNSDALRFALARIMATDIGRALAMDIRFEHWSCDVVGEDDPSHLNISQKIISIPLPCAHVSHLNRFSDYKSIFVLAVFESLRRMWHVNVGAPSSNCWAFRDLLLWNRCLRADLDLMNIVFAYQDHGLGHADLWRFMLASPQSDMAQFYAESMNEFPVDVLSDDHFDLLADIYMSWFYDDHRVNQCDTMTLSALDDLLRDSTSLGVIGTNKITAHDIVGLSLYPQGGAPYLEVMASEIIYTQDYRDIRCPILDAHADQIESELTENALHTSNLLVFRDPSLNRLFQTGSTLDTIG